MKTVRQNVFETNSSSCHVVTILSDKEYHDVEDGKAFINYDGDVEALTEDRVSKYLKDSIRIVKESIDRSQKHVADFSSYIEKDTLSWPEEILRAVCYSYKSKTANELKQMMDEKIQCFNIMAKNDADKRDRYEEVDAKKLLNIISSLASSFEAVKDEELEYGEYKTMTDIPVTETEFELACDYLSSYDNIETYGAGYEESDHSSRTIDGVTVHVLSYSGYDG